MKFPATFGGHIDGALDKIDAGMHPPDARYTKPSCFLMAKFRELCLRVKPQY